MGRHFKHSMEKIKKINILLASALIIGALVFGVSKGNNEKNANKKVIGTIIPHHLLVENQMDQFYQKLAKENPEISKIILISPNHMGRGLNFLQTTDNFSDLGLPTGQASLPDINQLVNHSPLYLEPKSFEKEHGIYNHLPFLKKYFPRARLIPIIIKLQTPENRLQMLISDLQKIITTDTLIIASVDFTHYESEKIALENDNRTIAWLESLDSDKISKTSLEDVRDLAKSPNKNTYEAVAFDSPESLYLLIKLLNHYNATDFSLYKRTSTLSLTKLTNFLDNTSHIFGEFQPPKL